LFLIERPNIITVLMIALVESQRGVGIAHDMLIVVPPDSGKTLTARALRSILPAMNIKEALDVNRVYSVAEMLSSGMPRVRQWPFRAPHNTISHAASTSTSKCRATSAKSSPAAA
jgi:predicted ATPase with chaperone activity